MAYNRREVLKYFKEQKDATEKRVNEGIEKYRKGDMKINLCDQSGAPLKNAKVKVTLKNHDFNFGANIFMLDTLIDYAKYGDKYADHFKAGYDMNEMTDKYEEFNLLYKENFKNLFNFATVPFYWRDNEPEKGLYRYDKDEPHIHRRPPASDCVKFCKENGIRTKAHCLNYDGHDPNWVHAFESHEDVRREYEERCRICAEKYADDIYGWEVTNETLVKYDHPAGKTAFYFQPDFVKYSFDIAKKYFKNNELIINDNHETVWEPYHLYNRSSYYMQIENELLKGTPIDTIGMQFHVFYSREDEIKMAEKFYNPEHLFKVMDQYADFGKPFQITEITIPTYSNDPEDEQIQAELIKNLYSIWFSHPNMEAIVYWNMVEGFMGPMFDMEAGENVYYGGFMRKDFTHKPSYNVLYDLIHKEWHTELELTTDENGSVDFKGFYGDYELQIDGKTHNFGLHKDGEKETNMTV